MSCHEANIFIPVSYTHLGHTFCTGLHIAAEVLYILKAHLKCDISGTRVADNRRFAEVIRIIGASGFVKANIPVYEIDVYKRQALVMPSFSSSPRRLCFPR